MQLSTGFTSHVGEQTAIDILILGPHHTISPLPAQSGIPLSNKERYKMLFSIHKSQTNTIPTPIPMLTQHSHNTHSTLTHPHTYLSQLSILEGHCTRSSCICTAKQKLTAAQSDLKATPNPQLSNNLKAISYPLFDCISFRNKLL